MLTNTGQSISQEVAEFLVSQPSLDALADFEVSPVIQQQMDSLLDRNHKGQLSEEERLKLEKMLAVFHVLSLVKAKAQMKLESDK